MMFRDEIVENMKQVTELRMSDMLSDEEFVGRMEALLSQYRTARGFAPTPPETTPPEPPPEPLSPEQPLFALHIESPTGNKQRSEFALREVTIGRSSESDLILRRNDISRRHARIMMRDGRFVVLDLKSENGTYVNSQRIGSPQVVQPGEMISIGDYKLSIEALEEGDDASN